MSQSQNSINLRKEFRIGSCNFSLQTCRWKSINFRQKTSQNEFLPHKIQPLRIPNIRLHQTSIVLSDHIYMFGGEVQGTNNETFCAINLKNNKWHELKLQSNPCMRDAHGLAILQHEIYMFGGSNKQIYFNDLYSFNNFTNEWKLIESKGDIPSARDQMIFISVKNQYLLLIGGINMHAQNKYFEDIYIWKQYQWKLLKSNYPSNLILSKAVQINGRVFMFGGYNREKDQYKSTLYELFVNLQAQWLTFKQVKLGIEVSPQGRINHQLIPVNNQYFLLIGGQRLNKKSYRDMWIFDSLLVRWSRIQPSNGPLKQIHSFSGVLYNNIIYLIGGYIENKKQISDEIIMIEFGNQQILKSQICENCISLIEKKQLQNKKYPKNFVISVGFLYNMALEIKYPFHAISMIYEGCKYLNANQFRISIEKTLNQFNYLKVQFNGNSFTKQQFISFITHNYINSKFKAFTQNVKLGAFRLGKTFLLVTSNTKHRFVYLLSAQSRISPHFDQSYIYYSYIQNLQLQRIQTQQGIKQRSFILNILKTYLSNPQIILQTQQKTHLLIFQTKVVMTAERSYICQLQQYQNDIKIWKNNKKVQFLEERGYKIQEQLQISLRKWFMFYHLQNNIATLPKFYINQTQQPVHFINYSKDILTKFQQKGLIHKVQLPNDIDVQIKGQIYITTHPYLIQHNYGLLIYSLNKLYTRYDIEFGRLFPQHFYKSKYKRAKTIFYELGYINIIKGLEQNVFKNGFTRPEKYAVLLQKIKQKCDQKRDQILQKQLSNQQNQDSQNKGTKKVKV